MPDYDAGSDQKYRANDITEAVKAGHDDDERRMPLIRHARLAHEGIGAHKTGDQGTQNQYGRRIPPGDKKIFQMPNTLSGIPANRQITGQTRDNTKLKAVHRPASATAFATMPLIPWGQPKASQPMFTAVVIGRL
jgi:hypothetical protein